MSTEESGLPPSIWHMGRGALLCLPATFDPFQSLQTDFPTWLSHLAPQQQPENLHGVSMLLMSSAGAGVSRGAVGMSRPGLGCPGGRGQQVRSLLGVVCPGGREWDVPGGGARSRFLVKRGVFWGKKGGPGWGWGVLGRAAGRVLAGGAGDVPCCRQFS